jgi:hypothetical protein
MLKANRKETIDTLRQFARDAEHHAAYHAMQWARHAIGQILDDYDAETQHYTIDYPQLPRTAVPGH